MGNLRLQLSANAWFVIDEAQGFHLSGGHTDQGDSPIGLDLELLKRALKEPPKTPRNGP